MTARRPAPAGPSPVALRSAAVFSSWWRRSGHWVYEDAGQALACWRSRGIVGLPAWLPGCDEAVAGLVAESQAFLAALRAREPLPPPAWSPPPPPAA